MVLDLIQYVGVQLKFKKAPLLSRIRQLLGASNRPRPAPRHIHLPGQYTGGATTAKSIGSPLVSWSM